MARASDELGEVAQVDQDEFGWKRAFALGCGGVAEGDGSGIDAVELADDIVDGGKLGIDVRPGFVEQRPERLPDHRQLVLGRDALLDAGAFASFGEQGFEQQFEVLAVGKHDRVDERVALVPVSRDVVDKRVGSGLVAVEVEGVAAPVDGCVRPPVAVGGEDPVDLARPGPLACVVVCHVAAAAGVCVSAVSRASSSWRTFTTASRHGMSRSPPVSVRSRAPT